MKRLGILTFLLIIFVYFIVLVNNSYQEGLEEAYVPLNTESTMPEIEAEKGVFKRSAMALDYANMPADDVHKRSLRDYYDNKAFHGAPPSIPHPVANENTIGADACLQCHQNGGFVKKFDAFAPVTPHPEMVNCRQCHVAVYTSSEFEKNNFYKKKAPKAGVNNALLDSPPIIPHQIQMRENCLSCHAGPAAPEEIRVTHPERINCRQCHVVNNKEVKAQASFKRPSYE